jgi:hypothetical protein
VYNDVYAILLDRMRNAPRVAKSTVHGMLKEMRQEVKEKAREEAKVLLARWEGRAAAASEALRRELSDAAADGGPAAASHREVRDDGATCAASVGTMAASCAASVGTMAAAGPLGLPPGSHDSRSSAELPPAWARGLPPPMDFSGDPTRPASLPFALPGGAWCATSGLAPPAGGGFVLPS